MVVRNGHARERKAAMGPGMMPIAAPRVHDRREEEQFTSATLPPYMRHSPRLEEALPIQYLRGLVTGDSAPALKVLLGEAAASFSPTTISRLEAVWEDEYAAWPRRDLSDRRYVYVWPDGVNFAVRLEEDRVTCLVIIGVNEGSSKELLALQHGYRESAEFWSLVLRDLERHGMEPAVLAGVRFRNGERILPDRQIPQPTDAEGVAA